MKTKNFISLFITVAVCCFISCSDARRNEISNHEDNMNKNIDTTAQETHTAFVKDKEEFSAHINKLIEKNRQDIVELKAKAKTKKAEVKQRYDEEISKLEKKNDEMKIKLSEYNEESQEKWRNFKEKFSHDMDELDQSISDLFRDNSKDKDRK